MSIELTQFKFDDLGFQVCSGEASDFFHFRFWRETTRERSRVSEKRLLVSGHMALLQVTCLIVRVS